MATVTSKQIINELKKINPQCTVPAAILMAIRGKMELKAGIRNRIGRAFQDGNRHLLLVGKAGGGKTRSLKGIFDGLGLESYNTEGRQIGRWIPSAGMSTGKGIYDVLLAYNDAIIGIDEISIDTDKHRHVLKQIGSGEISRMVHGDIQAYPFTGLVLSGTNGVKVPKSRDQLEHLLAVLDRFMIVSVDPKEKDPSIIIDDIINQQDEDSTFNIDCDWDLIGQSLTRKNYSTLNLQEKTLLKSVWTKKSAEILDASRPQYRNSWAALDIFLFVKRFFGVENICDDPYAKGMAIDMIDDCILFNPVNILWLDPLQDIIYSMAKNNGSVTHKDIADACDKIGHCITRQTIHNTLNRMIENFVICRISRGKYSIKRNITQANNIKANKTVVDCL